MSEIIEKTNNTESIRLKKIFVICSKEHFSITEKKDGIELNEGYEFEVDGALPEIADGIAKFANELEKNGFGQNSGRYFMSLINNFYDKLQQEV